LRSIETEFELIICRHNVPFVDDNFAQAVGQWLSNEENIRDCIFHKPIFTTK
jgi:hypothetical protein